MLTTCCWCIQAAIETNKKKCCDQYHETNYEIKLRYSNHDGTTSDYNNIFP